MCGTCVNKASAQVLGIVRRRGHVFTLSLFLLCDQVGKSWGGHLDQHSAFVSRPRGRRHDDDGATTRQGGGQEECKAKV
mgnify:CR=1 FL=1